MEIGSHRRMVVCAGARASEIASYLRDQHVVGEPVAPRGFVDDRRFEPTFEGAPLLGGIDQLAELVRTRASQSFLYIDAVGNNRTRAAVVGRIEHLQATNLTPRIARHVSTGSETRCRSGPHASARVPSSPCGPRSAIIGFSTQIAPSRTMSSDLHWSRPARARRSVVERESTRDARSSLAPQILTGFMLERGRDRRHSGPRGCRRCPGAHRLAPRT